MPRCLSGRNMKCKFCIYLTDTARAQARTLLARLAVGSLQKYVLHAQDCQRRWQQETGLHLPRLDIVA